MRRFLLILFILSISLLTLYLSRLGTAEYCFKILLARAGFSDVSLSLSNITLEQVTIAHASASSSRQGLPTAVEITNLAVRFVPRLLLQKRIQSLDADRITLTLPQGTKTEQPFKPQMVTALLDPLKKQTSFFDSLKINELIIHNSALAGASGRSMSLELENHEGKSEVRLRMVLAATSVLEGSAVYEKSGQLSIHVNTAPQTSGLQANLTLDGHQLSFDAAVELQHLRPILEAEFGPGLPLEAGTIRTSATCSLQQPSPVKVLLEGENLISGDVSLEQITTKLELSEFFSQSPLTIGKGSRLAGVNLRKGPLTLGKIEISPEGLLDLKQKVYQNTTDTPWILETVSSDNFQIGRLVLTPPFTLSKNAAQELLLSSPPALEMHDFSGKGVTISQLQLLPVKEPHLSTLHLGKKLSFKTDRWQTGQVRLEKGDITIEASPLSITLHQLSQGLKKIEATASVEGEHLVIIKGTLKVPIKDLRSSLNLKDNVITATTLISPEETAGRLQALLHHDLGKQAGQVRLSCPEPLTISDKTSLEELVTGLNLPLELTKTTVDLVARAKWKKREPLQMSSTLSLADTDGTIKNIPFWGLSLDHDFEVLPQLRSLKSGTITLKKMVTPIDIENLATKVAVQPSTKGSRPKITFEDLNAELFGGHIHTNSLEYDLNGPDTNSILDLKSIDLPKVVTAQQIQGLEISGQVDGTLPIRLGPAGASVDWGQLENSNSGGTIRYHPGSDSFQNSQFTAYALKALEEFHYTQLKATVTYSPDGLLLMGMHLQGTSPGLGTTRPVHLNINTEQNLLSLLQSLKYSKSLTNELDQRVQQHYQPPQTK